MASLRTCLPPRRTAAAQVPWLRLERQFSLLRVNTAKTDSASNRSRTVAQTRNSSTSSTSSEGGGGGLLEDDEFLATLFDATSSLSVSPDQPAGDRGGRGRDRDEGGQRTVAGLPSFARALPVSPSYFSRQPQFNDSFLRLQALFRQYGHLPTAPPDQVERVAWKSLRDFRHGSGEVIKAPQYNQCITMVKQLHKIHPSLKPASVVDALAEFRRAINPFEGGPRPLPIDRFGRAIGVGRRKTSVARAWVVEGTGEVLVNGKSLSEAFGRVHDRESATWALRATERIDKYNVWALVDGGGTTGQAEALTLAVAKGLVAHEPALKTALRKAGCIQRDIRMVERKKHGHVKARKMPAWVKR